MKQEKAVAYFSKRLADTLGVDVSVKEFRGQRSFCIGQDKDQYWICINGRDRFLCDGEDELIYQLIDMLEGIMLYKEYKGGK